MAVKRRIIWLEDEDWEALKEAAKKHGWNVSQEIRNIWVYADRAADGLPITLRTPEETAQAKEVREEPEFEDRWDLRPLRPAPKGGTRKR